MANIKMLIFSLFIAIGYQSSAIAQTSTGSQNAPVEEGGYCVIFPSLLPNLPRNGQLPLPDPLPSGKRSNCLLCYQLAGDDLIPGDPESVKQCLAACQWDGTPIKPGSPNTQPGTPEQLERLCCAAKYGPGRIGQGEESRCANGCKLSGAGQDPFGDDFIVNPNEEKCREFLSEPNSGPKVQPYPTVKPPRNAR